MLTKWQKYTSVVRMSWGNGLVYRTSFCMWRVRMMIQLAVVYVLWYALTTKTNTPFGMEREMLFTYVLGSSIVRSVVLSSKSIDAQTEIATGELSNYLVKPINYCGYWFAKDLADKLLNTCASIVEVGVLYLIARPTVFIQADGKALGLCALALSGAIVLYFLFSFMVSMTTFWYSEANGWPQRFLILTLLEFFIGALFPLAILPEKIAQALVYAPTTYFIYFPLQVYLGNIAGMEILKGFGVMVCWLAIFAVIVKKMWSKGVRSYEAYGR